MGGVRYLINRTNPNGHIVIQNKDDSDESDTRIPDKKEISDRLGITEDQFHNEIKDEIIKQAKEDKRVKKSLRDIRNPDVGINKNGDIILKDRKTGREIKTDLKFDWFKS